MAILKKIGLVHNFHVLVWNSCLCGYRISVSLALSLLHLLSRTLFNQHTLSHNLFVWLTSRLVQISGQYYKN